MVDPVQLLSRLLHRESLSREETRGLFERIMRGEVDPIVIAGIVGALATKGETVDELVGAAQALRAHMTVVATPPGVNALDTCGTGGDGKPTFNVSTAVAIVAAAAGATVAKHGNRSHTRPSGAADVVRALGISAEADVAALEQCLRELRVAFLFAPQLHPAMRHAAIVRKTLGVRTIFNLVGPLANPAGVKRQLLGVPRPEHVDMMLRVLGALGSERIMVVHGLEGLCDISISGPTLVGCWDGASGTTETVDFTALIGGSRPLAETFVASPAESAAMIERVLAGERGSSRELVLLNAAAALWVAGAAAGIAEGLELARDAIDTGAAARTLAAWRHLTPASPMQ